MRVAQPASPDGPPLSERGWRYAVVALHAAFAAIAALAAATVLVDSGVSRAGKTSALIALAVLTAAYLLLGRVGLTARSERHTAGYLAVLVAALAVIAWADPGVLFLFFIAYPQVWFLVDQPRTGVVWTLALVLAGTAGMLLHLRVHGGGVITALGSQLIGVVFSLLFGLWSWRLIEQSRRQAELIGSLERAEAALAAAHHARGVLAERERVAREVHDTLAQGYTSIVLLARTAIAQLADRPELAAERLAMIEEVARANLQEARAVVAALAPPDLEDHTLQEALTRLADRFARETGIGVSVQVDVDPGTLRRVEEVVFVRAAQEALSNARRHAAAHRVVLRLEKRDGQIELLVEDDGVGFDARDAGSGLTGLRRRVEQAGGSFEVQTSPGGGTRVVARLAAPA